MLSGTKEVGIAKEAAAAVPEVATEEDPVSYKENVDENHESLLEGSPSPSLLHPKVSPLVQVGFGGTAISGKLLCDQSHDQRCVDTTAHNKPLPVGDSASTDSGSTPVIEKSPTFEMSPTIVHLSPSALNQ